MKVAFNTMFKNEQTLFNEILKTWVSYPVDLFVFYDDNSTDNSIDIIKKYLPESRFIIINDKLDKFNESYQRQRMIDVSRENKVDYVFSIDCDELLSSNIITNFTDFLKIYEKQDLFLFWYNCVNNNLKKYRNDPQAKNNFRSFVLPLNKTGNLDTSSWKYHTPRTPHINLPKLFTKEFGVIHLQSLNVKYYAIKQLWYKHYELINYGHDINFINNRYDPVVNNLKFDEIQIDENLIQNINFDVSIFEDLEIEKGYVDFIKNNLNKKLVTFGNEYLQHHGIE